MVLGFQVGGVDYITKPFQIEEVLCRVKTHLENALLKRALQQRTEALTRANEQLQREMAERQQAENARNQAVDAKEKVAERLDFLSQMEAAHWGIEGFIGRSPTITRILTETSRLQHANTTTVLISGESGTGKELIARAIHFGGTRKGGPFIPVNCSAIPRELAESSFFGHVRGAFTGADTSRKGYFELADGGTLFLDEVGEMSIELQVKLLRVLEDVRITPVGGTDEKQLDVRILAPTHADLQANYLLTKMQRYGLLVREGTGRWSRYRLPGCTLSLNDSQTIYMILTCY